MTANNTQTRRPKTMLCSWCRAKIKIKPRGRVPKFCSQGCRQRAYEIAKYRPLPDTAERRSDRGRLDMLRIGLFVDVLEQAVTKDLPRELQERLTARIQGEATATFMDRQTGKEYRCKLVTTKDGNLRLPDDFIAHLCIVL